MPISEKDKAFMRKVAAYFRHTKTPKEPNGSIRDTATHFAISRNKVRKILVTMGELVMPHTQSVVELRARGLGIKEIAAKLGVSVATVSMSLPYEDKIDNSLDPSQHTAKVRSYRAYEQRISRGQASTKKKTERQAAKQSRLGGNMQEKEWQKDIQMSYRETYHRPHRSTWADVEGDREQPRKKMKNANVEALRNKIESFNKEVQEKRKRLDELEAKENLTADEQKQLDELRHKLGHFLGALGSRDARILEEIAGDRLPPEPLELMRLHMELYSDYEPDDVKETLRQYGGVQYGDRISRDVVVPSDIPLYALHYVIQRAFGWGNSHLHQFTLPNDRTLEMSGNTLTTWTVMLGILFRSPLMDEDDQFWADDYQGGSFKNWLRKKYTGPYLSQCQGEGLISCWESMMQLDMEEEYYLLYERQGDRPDGDEFLTSVQPVRAGKPKPLHQNTAHRIECVETEDIPAEGIRWIFEQNPFALLERLPLCFVLAPGQDKLPELCDEQEKKAVEDSICHSATEMYRSLRQSIHNVIAARNDSPLRQVMPIPCTDTLLYEYDFGDGWRIKITASENCPDLVESGRVTQTELDRANVKCRETYRPVLIAKDGEMLLDDVGGLNGYAEFLRAINPDMDSLTDADACADAKQQKKELLEWAKDMGWKKEKISDFNLL